jgi:hypothetical protein
VVQAICELFCLFRVTVGVKALPNFVHNPTYYTLS